MAGNSTRAILTALGANFAIAIAKGVAAFFTGSGAMLAETVHSLADCGNQGLLLLGMKQAKLPPSPEYPLGRGKEIYFWSFLVAVMLFTVGGVYSLYEGWHKLLHPEPLSQWWWAAGVLAFAIAAEAYSTHAALSIAGKERRGRSYWRWFRESRQAELIVIVGENVAALLGLVFALAAVLLSVATGNPMWDALGTLAIGLLLIVVAVFVAIEVKAMLVGQSADPVVQRKILEFLEARPAIERVVSLVTLQLGDEIMVSIQAQMKPPQGTEAVDEFELIDRIEQALRQVFPQIRWIFFEPDNDPD